jgi:hypothetical protein
MQQQMDTQIAVIAALIGNAFAGGNKTAAGKQAGGNRQIHGKPPKKMPSRTAGWHSRLS